MEVTLAFARNSPCQQDTKEAVKRQPRFAGSIALMAGHNHSRSIESHFDWLDCIWQGFGCRQDFFLWMIVTAMKLVAQTYQLTYCMYYQWIIFFPDRSDSDPHVPFRATIWFRRQFLRLRTIPHRYQMENHVSPESLHAVWCLLRHLPSDFQPPRNGQFPRRRDPLPFNL